MVSELFITNYETTVIYVVSIFRKTVCSIHAEIFGSDLFFAIRYGVFKKGRVQCSFKNTFCSIWYKDLPSLLLPVLGIR